MFIPAFLYIATGVLCLTAHHDATGGIMVDTGNLKVGIDQAGNLYSIVFKGEQWAAKTATQNGIHKQSSAFGSGLQNANVWFTTKDGCIIVHLTGTAMGTGPLNAYYIFKPGQDRIYFGVQPTNRSVGELRFLFRLDLDAFPYSINEACEVSNGVQIEGSDVFKVDGETHSKFYSSVPFKYNSIYGLKSRKGEGIYFALDQAATETMSGGPFFRDITSQGTNQNQQLSAYLFSGHSQSENFRPGLKLFSASFGQRPSELPDLSFIAGLDLPGYIAESRRGNLHGAVKGMGALQAGCGRSRDWYTLLRHTDTVSRVSEIHRDGPDLTLSRLDENDAHSEYTVVLSNQAAQYWADVDMDGAFAIDAALPGTYRMKLYHDQKEVASTVVTIAAGRTTGASIAAPTEPEVVWSIGCNDGRPHGFKNADRIERMHPSDPRMKKWEPTTFAVGSPVNQFPMAQIRSLNPTTIQFSLSADQATGARTLLISITASFAKGSPQITVNGEKQKVSSHPAAATFYGAPVYASRAFTRGSYLGIPTTYTFTSLPLKAGLNEILIDVASGASSSGRSPFLQPSFTYDYVALL